jgi:hypothetical protein
MVQKKRTSVAVLRLSGLANGEPAWPLRIHLRTDGDLCSGGLEKERYFGAATAQLHRCRCPVATLRLISLLRWQKKRKERERQKKKGKKENRGKKKK